MIFSCFTAAPDPLSRLALPGLVGGTILMFGGLGPVFTLGTDLIVGAAPPERAGAAAAISEASSDLGGALRIAILGAAGAAVYRGAMVRAHLQAVPAIARRAARDSLGGAAAVAAHLPRQAATELVAARRAAFPESFLVIAAICTVIAASTAVMALVTLRRRPATDNRHAPEPAALAA